MIVDDDVLCVDEQNMRQRQHDRLEWAMDISAFSAWNLIDILKNK